MEKKLLFKIIILLSLFLFSGCGKKETIASYSKIMIGIEEDEAITCTFMEENAYLYCVDHNGVTEIYKAGYSGTEKNRILEKCGDLVVLDISRNSQGEILLLGMPRNSRDNLYLYLYDIQENLISQSSVSETVGGEGINLCVDAEGNVAVAGTNNSVYLFDKEGKYQFSVQGFDVLAGVESDGEHTFYAAGYSTSNYVIKSFLVSEEGDKKEFTKTPDFINLLELCKEYPDKPDSIEEKKAENLIKDNKEIYIPALIDTAYAYEAYQLLFDRNIGLTGFPVESGNGISEVSAGGLAMSSQSEHKEGVWRFLRTLLQDDYQIKRSNVEFPISRKILLKTLEEIQNEKYYEGEDGEAVKILQETLSYGGTEYPVYAISEETSTEILDLISKVDGTDHYDLEVWNIIQEEAEIFFLGNKTAPEVAEVIQNRVTIYLKEIEKHITF